jgi:hypothetical protein
MKIHDLAVGKKYLYKKKRLQLTADLPHILFLKLILHDDLYNK